MDTEQSTEISSVNTINSTKDDLSEKYRLIALSTSDFISFTTFDIPPVFTFVSPSHKKMGYDTEDLLGKSGLDFIHDDDKEHIMEILLTYIEAKMNGALTDEMVDNAPKLDFRFRDKAGNWHFLHSTVDIVNDELLLISKDITEQKKAEQMLQESEAKYRNLVERANDGILILQDSRIIYVNPYLARLWGGQREEMIGTLFTDHINVCDRLRIIGYYHKRLAGEQAPSIYEASLKRKNGETFQAEVNTGVITLEGKPAQLTIIRDITERKKIEESLRESEEKYRTIVENTKDVILVTLRDGRISYASPASVMVLGYEPEKLLGTALDIIHPDDAVKAQTALQDALHGKRVTDLEYRIITKAGETKWVSHSWSPITLEGGTLKYIVSVVRDVTKSKIFEENLKEKILELEHYKNVTVDREMRMIELKEEINDLYKKLNQKPKYAHVSD
jgi:PAS domain S-box-containing protein